MKRKRILYLLQFILGAVLIAMSILVFASDNTKMISGLCIGFGAVMLVFGIGSLIRSFVVSAVEDKEIKRIKNIEVNDERNVRIREKTGFMVSRIMNYVLSAFILILGFLGADKVIIIMAVSLIIIEFISVIIFSNYYAKKY